MEPGAVGQDSRNEYFPGLCDDRFFVTGSFDYRNLKMK